MNYPAITNAATLQSKFTNTPNKINKFTKSAESWILSRLVSAIRLCKTSTQAECDKCYEDFDRVYHAQRATIADQRAAIEDIQSTQAKCLKDADKWRL